jgi:hypothetical protein
MGVEEGGRSRDITNTFKSSSEGSAGFVRVIGGEEGYADKTERTFRVPPNHSFEVLGCMIKFTRA